MDVSVEKKGIAAVAWIPGRTHVYYEDRFRLLCRPIPIVEKQDRGEIFAVFDGIGSAPKGMSAAQEMCDVLVDFYREPERYAASYNSIEELLITANRQIFDWGFMPHSDTPLGGCVGTVVWIYEEEIHVFHAGDTLALLIRDGTYKQLTAPHELGGVIYSYFGMGDELHIDVNHYEIEECDRIILMSDGVTKAMKPEAITTLVENHYDISFAVSDIVNQSRQNGSQDDITAMIIEVEFDI